MRYIPKFYVILFLVLDSDNMRIADSKWAIYTTREVLFEKEKKSLLSLHVIYWNTICSIRYDCRLCIHTCRIYIDQKNLYYTTITQRRNVYVSHFINITRLTLIDRSITMLTNLVSMHLKQNVYSFLSSCWYLLFAKKSGDSGALLHLRICNEENSCFTCAKITKNWIEWTLCSLSVI